MAKHFDLSDILTDDRPTIKVGNKTFTINCEKSIVLRVNAILKKKGEDLEGMEDALKILLGEKGYKEFNELDLPVSAYKSFYLAVIACVQDEEREVVEKRFRTA